ncbi:3-methyladenine DNA glycosylase [Helicobacter anatolicus]|uniref:3-methyladenine DNA glycosylase n=1 Tax=Helicobacter anatolicus TaxID=2905874 RepID=UPI001E3FA5A3|nr:3-methyladenine DNA glycosylase [Helicobacter anatolicus]MCE3039199.1 3-methyladenine DNA glycosylase [Helicobacter anatolicus]
MLESSYSLFLALKKMDLLKNSSLYWWPNALSFEVVVGAILTQNTKWENVEKSLKNLKDSHILCKDNTQSLKNFSKLSVQSLANLIYPSGFYNQKSSRLYRLSLAILEEFGNFENFVENVSREWLLSQKGIGMESADSILNYACDREVMVVDKYTQKLLASLGYEFDDYEEIQSWLERGIKENFSQLQEYKSLSLVYARFHGKIVEFSKKKLVFNAKHFGDF